jgi:hypothetical protein
MHRLPGYLMATIEGISVRDFILECWSFYRNVERGTFGDWVFGNYLDDIHFDFLLKT